MNNVKSHHRRSACRDLRPRLKTDVAQGQLCDSRLGNVNPRRVWCRPGVFRSGLAIFTVVGILDVAAILVLGVRKSQCLC